MYNGLVLEEGLRDHSLHLLLCLCLPPAFIWLARHKVLPRYSAASPPPLRFAHAPRVRVRVRLHARASRVSCVRCVSCAM